MDGNLSRRSGASEWVDGGKRGSAAAAMLAGELPLATSESPHSANLHAAALRTLQPATRNPQSAIRGRGLLTADDTP